MLDSCHDFTMNLQAAAVTSCSYAFHCPNGNFQGTYQTRRAEPRFSSRNKFSTGLSTIPRWPLKELKYN